ncbi:hypothetical protein MACJ_000313 [Theileria orientalis]|uniref:Signal peptide-containing protein n=1 Tax=Theileria orientalis TaxID=68886 RepID=A0A976QUH0_THEOR|nr:hypothetical protein MACJ_000313 [Theileria orientalis]
MLVRALVLGFLAGCSVLADQYVSVELNMLNDPAVVSSELDFLNSRVLTHDVNPGFYVDRVTESGLMVWKAMKAGHRVTNALLFVNEHGPRLINLTVSVGEGQSQLLMFLYTLNGWVNFNDVNPFNIRLEEPESDAKDNASLDLPNGEHSFNNDPLEGKYSDEPVVLDINETFNNKFNYKFKYTAEKNTYKYMPKHGYYVNEIKEGNKKVWSKEKDQLVTEIVVDKQSDEFVSLHVYYLTSGNPKSLSYIKEGGEWKLSSNVDETEEKSVKKSVKKEPVALGEFLKPLNRTTKFDYNEIPQPPLCRGCTYEIDGITHNVLYFSNDSKYRNFVDGSLPVFDLPNDCVATSSCFYTKNDNTLFVDIVYKKDNLTEAVYFEKGEEGYTVVTRDEFEARILKYKEIPVMIDISREKTGYTVEITVKNDIENKFYKPSEGYVVRMVTDGDMKVFEVPSYILEVSVTNLGEDKRLMLILYENNSFYTHNYYTYYPELGRWARVSEYFYYKMIEEFSQNLKIRNPSLDISNLTTVKKFVHFSKNEALSHYTFNPKTGVVLNSVLDAGRMVWTPRYPNETCEFVCYSYKAQLLYLVSKADSKVRQYSYEKTGDNWSFINDEEFKKRFAFAYAANLTADIRSNFSNKFTVEESGNVFHITPKPGYLVTRVRYKDRTIWVGSGKLKCTSFYLTYGKLETYLYLNLLDSNMNTSTKYLKTMEGDVFKWRECGGAECKDDASRGLTNGSLTRKSHVDFNNETMSKEVPAVTKLAIRKEKRDRNKVPPKTPLSTILEEERSEIEAEDKESAGTLTLNEDVLKNKVPGSLDYLTGKELSLPPLKYEERLALTNEPHNTEKVDPSVSMALALVDSSNELVSPDESLKNTKVNPESDSAKLEKESKVAGEAKFDIVDSRADLSAANNAYDFESDNCDGVYANPYSANSNNTNEVDDSYANTFDASNVNVYSVDFSQRASPSTADKANDVNDLNNAEHLTKLGNFNSVEGVDGKNVFNHGVLYLQDMKYAKEGEYKDGRDFGYDYLFFTPYPNHPITELRDAHEVIWKSHIEKCLAVVVHLRAGFQIMAELFIKTSTEVVRRHFEFSGYKWVPMESNTYNRVCELDDAMKKN